MTKTEERLADGFAALHLPTYMLAPTTRYVVDHLPPGDFLTAIICNDLRGALTRADSTNRTVLSEWVCLFTYSTPAICWGSRENFQAWITPSKT